MSAWSVGVWALVPAAALPLCYALRGTVVSRLVALQLASALTTVLLLLMSFAFGQDSYTSLAIGLSLVNAAGTLVLATAVERWL